MTENSVFSASERQPNPSPPAFPVVEAPSILFYAGLIIFAILLIWLAFEIGEPDWPGLLINLASGIVGATIILILVDRRLRASELYVLQRYAETAKVRSLAIISRDIRSSTQYAKVFHRQLYEIQKHYYISIPAAEAIPTSNPDGFFLIGAPGSGKTTLLQRFALKNAEEVIRHPKEARIPIFVPAFGLIENEIPFKLWESVCSYYVVKRRIFEKWLADGRVMVIIDGIDENQDPLSLLQKIAHLKTSFPKVAIIASSRDHTLTPGFHKIIVENIGIPLVKMPGPSEEEITRIIKLRERFTDHQSREINQTTE